MPRLFALAALAVVFAIGISTDTSTTRAADAPKEFFFKPNDRIVFLGDSITKICPLS